MSNKLYSKFFVLFAMLSMMCIVAANIMAAKMIQVGPWALTAGTLIFPVVYVLNDLLAEVYGYTKVRFVIFTGFILNCVIVLFFQLAIVWPAPVWFDGGPFATVLSNTPRIVLAGLAAFLAGGLVNAKIMQRMRMTWSRQLFTRCVVSTLVGEFIDSTIFLAIAFVGTLPGRELVTMILIQASVKTLYEIVIYPVTRLVIQKVRKVDATAQA